MINTILAIKSHMEQAWTKKGRVPVTVVKSGPNIVTQIKTEDRDGYSAIQIGFGERKAKHTTKPLQGHLKKSQKQEPKNQSLIPRYLKEVRISQSEQLQPGDVINPQDVLKPGDLVKVTGISKGKGFAGVVKRHRFAGGPKTHGQSDRERAPGSIGQTTDPGRVYKGKRMAGHMGVEKVTVRNLTVLAVNDSGEIRLAGPVPGARKSLLILTKIGEDKKFGKEENGSQTVTDSN
jgi:large subunit ribosomal protein L3